MALQRKKIAKFNIIQLQSLRRNIINNYAVTLSVNNPKNLEVDLKKLRNRVEILERELAKSNADAVLILVQDLSAMKKDIKQMKSILRTNKKFAEQLP